MRRFNRLLAIPAILALVTVTACGGSSSSSSSDGNPVKGGTLTYAAGSDPGAGGFDPYVAGGAASFAYIYQIYEPLLSLDQNGKVAAGLADKWGKVNPTTYTFHMRPDVKFQDGSPLTPADIVFSLTQMRDNSVDQAPYYKNVKSVTATDESTVQVELAKADANFLDLVSNPTTCHIVNKKWYESTPKKKRETTVNGTGPFTLKDWRRGAEVSLVANKNYWQPNRPYLDGIDFKIVPDEQSRLAELKQGSVDMMRVKDATMADDAQGSNITVGKSSPTRTVPLNINMETGPLKDLRIRRAISMGIDRKQIIDLAMGGHADLSLNVPPGVGGIKPSSTTSNYKYDPKGAKALLKEAGAENVTVKLTYASDAAFALDTPMVETMKSQLKKVGINLKLNGVPFADALQRALSGNFTGMLLMPLAATPVPAGYLRFMQDLPRNKLGDLKPEGLKLLSAVNTAATQKELQEALKNIEMFCTKNVLTIIPYAMAMRTEMSTDNVHGYSTDPYSTRTQLKNTWISK